MERFCCVGMFVVGTSGISPRCLCEQRHNATILHDRQRQSGLWLQRSLQGPRLPEPREEGKAGTLLAEQHPQLQRSLGSRTLLASTAPMQHIFIQRAG